MGLAFTKRNRFRRPPSLPKSECGENPWLPGPWPAVTCAHPSRRLCSAPKSKGRITSARNVARCRKIANGKPPRPPLLRGRAPTGLVFRGLTGLRIPKKPQAAAKTKANPGRARFPRREFFWSFHLRDGKKTGRLAAKNQKRRSRAIW